MLLVDSLVSIYEVQEKLMNLIEPEVESNVQQSYTVNGIIEI